jgi:hypothetical protein
VGIAGSRARNHLPSGDAVINMRAGGIMYYLIMKAILTSPLGPARDLAPTLLKVGNFASMQVLYLYSLIP